MAIEQPPARRQAPEVSETATADQQPVSPEIAVLAVSEPQTPAWRQPWWKPAVGLPLYALGGALLLGGLMGGIDSAILQGLMVLGIGLLVADAWGCRQQVPLLRSASKRRAALGWAVVAALAVTILMLLPAA
ncbi:MAG: hypothetical protein JOZ39_04315 [Chloroflexi bacterium]|nr:hypothetical protein [Chloroflexota bacterium]